MAVSGKRPDRPSNPFAGLAGLREALPPGPTGHARMADAKPVLGPARAVIRYERKGRGGKEVTVVEHLGLGEAELEKWTKELKQTLGVGGHLDGSVIVLQGDCRPRLEAALLARGVRKVTVS